MVPPSTVSKTVSKGRAGVRLGLHLVLLHKLLHAALGVHDLLLTGEERVALRADLDSDGRLRRARLEAISAGTGYGRRHIFRMDSLFHSLNPRIFAIEFESQV